MAELKENPFNREVLVGDIIESWQSMLDLAAELARVPAGLITRVSGDEIEIFLSSRSEGNPYSEGMKSPFPDSGWYCEWVLKNRRTNLIPDARSNPMWKDNGAVGMNMVSYLGMPIMRPDGEVFGTICFLDCRENHHNESIVKLVEQFRRMIELTLNALFAREELARRDRLVASLSRIFPICAYCKTVRNEKEEWVPVERYIKDISGRQASHGICPQCYEKELLKDELMN